MALQTFPAASVVTLRMHENTAGGKNQRLHVRAARKTQTSSRSFFIRASPLVFGGKGTNGTPQVFSSCRMKYWPESLTKPRSCLLGPLKPRVSTAHQNMETLHTPPKKILLKNSAVCWKWSFLCCSTLNLSYSAVLQCDTVGAGTYVAALWPLKMTTVCFVVF